MKINFKVIFEKDKSYLSKNTIPGQIQLFVNDKLLFEQPDELSKLMDNYCNGIIDLLEGENKVFVYYSDEPLLLEINKINNEIGLIFGIDESNDGKMNMREILKFRVGFSDFIKAFDDCLDQFIVLYKQAFSEDYTLGKSVKKIILEKNKCLN